MLNRINKYIFYVIFNHLTYERRLNSIRYSKKIQAKLEISLYTYQKKYLKNNNSGFIKKFRNINTK